MHYCGVFNTMCTSGIPVLLTVIFGPKLVGGIIEYIPEWLSSGLSVAGGLPSGGWYWIIATISAGKELFWIPHCWICCSRISEYSNFRSSVDWICNCIDYL